MATDNDKRYQSTMDTFETLSNFPADHTVAGKEPSPEEEDILALSGEDEGDDSTGDFLRQLLGEEEIESGDNLLNSFLSTTDADSGETEPDMFAESDDSAKSLFPQPSAIDPELLECFNEEAADHLENLSDKLNELSASVSESCDISEEYQKILHSIRRSVHTMKGAAAVIGIEPVANWGHDFEDFLDWLHDESEVLSPEIVSIMLDGSDLLEKIAAQPTLSVDTEINAIKNRFLEIITQAKEALPTQPPAVDPELLESYSDEAEEHLGNINKQLNELSSSVSNRCSVSGEYLERLHSIFRSVHTLKGTAEAIGIEPVACWGYDFEDFLYTFNNESDILSPEILAAMLDGADILKKLVLDPTIDVSTEITDLQKTFLKIAAGTTVDAEISLEEKFSQAADTDKSTKLDAVELERKQIFRYRTWEESVGGRPDPARISGSKNRRIQQRESTLRVGSKKIAELMGLSGDMAVNLSSFENSASAMQSSLTEFEITLQRLKTVTSNLEAGYELTTLPHAVGSGPGKEINDEFDPLEMDRYSELHILIRSLNEAMVDLDSIRENISDNQNLWHLAVDRQRRMVNDMQGAVQSIQMTPFSTISNRLYRTVREAARGTGKQVRLLIENASIEMDTHVWDILADALMHMLRNSVDHGVEPPGMRQQVGKPEQATIRIQCSRHGNRFILHLSDDGKGLDYDAIKNRALKLYPDTGVEQMDDKELTGLIFKPGFSVRETATPLSGRGVGMDVVNNALDQLNGLIDVQSTPGQGINFVLSVPIVVAMLPALMVMFGRQQFAVPMHDISSVFRITGKEKEKDTLELNEEEFLLLRPAELLNLEKTATQDSGRSTAQDSALALAVDIGGRRGVVVTDAVIGQKNVVLKSLGSHLQNIPFIAGATILGDGTLVPILQTDDLFSRAETVVQSDKQVQEHSDDEKPLKILIVDDSISVRKVLNSVLTVQGWQVTAAIDGTDAIKKIRDSKPELILLDIEMPRMNGFEVLQTLQSQSAYRDIPVLMLTSRSAQKYKEKASELGARGFVTKPFKNDELVSLVSSLTRIKRDL
ncbi:MAG: response regulator [Desulfobacterales bacterium]|nr:response regulator [Desulfobacterales bacterium]